MRKSYNGPHEFTECVEDASMCECGVPVLTHWCVEPGYAASLRDEIQRLRADLAGVREIHAVYVKQAEAEKADVWRKGYNAGASQEESLAAAQAAYERGRKVTTKRPDNSVNARIETP